MKLLGKLEKQKSTWFLMVTLSLFFFLRLPSLFEPYWYGDEGIYQVIGMALRQGRTLYSGIWDNKPPLLYYIYALFNGDQFSVRLFSLLIGLLSVLVFFFLAKKIFQNNQRAIYIATSIFAILFGTPFLEGNIANAENFMILPIVSAALLVFQTTGKTHKPYLIRYKLFLAGLLLGIAFLIKVVSIFDFGAFFVFIFFITYINRQSIKKQMLTAPLFFAGFIFPIATTTIYFFIQGKVNIFIASAFLSNISYVSYGNDSIIPHVFLLLKLFLLFLFIIFLFIKRYNMSSQIIFVLLWSAFSLFNVFFSQRPYTHYILTFIACFSLSVGFCFYNKKSQRFFLVTGITLILLMNIEFSLHTRWDKYLFGYYENFIAFITQQKSTHDYFSYFDKAVPTDYEIASYIKMHQNTMHDIFMWGNSGQMYKLTNTLPPGRFIVIYHMTLSQKNIDETGRALTQEKPKYILILPKQPLFPYSLIQYQPKISIDNAIIYEKIF